MTVHKFPKPNLTTKLHAAQAARRSRLADFAPCTAAAPAALLSKCAQDVRAALVQPRTLLELAAQLSPDDHIALHFMRGPKAWRFDMSASRAGGEPDGFDTLLGTVAPRVSFADAPAESPKNCRIAVRLAPRPTVVPSVGEETLWLPSPDLAGANLTLALQVAFKLGVESLTITARSFRLCDDARAALHAALFRLGESKVAAGPEMEARREHILDWLNAGRGCALDVELVLDRALTAQEIAALSTALFGCAGQVAAPPRAIDLRMAFPAGSLPPWRFWPTPADLSRCAKRNFAVAAAPGAITIGLDAADQPVRIGAEDRMRHMSIIGATGAGKTTLMENALMEDIVHGEGCLLVDAHGDMANRMLAAIPAHRREDVIWIDLGSDELEWRLDLFQTAGIFPDAERNRVANQLVAQFRQIYAGVPEAFGPAFEMYFRNTILLLFGAADEADRSLLKFESVFADRAFRRKLLDECKDERVIQFWRGIAEEITGDWTIANMAPYIICKLNQLNGNPLTRRFIGGDKPRLDLRRAMDERKIVLVNLNKGIIGDMDVRFIGGLVLMAVTEAAMGRCRMPMKDRIPFRLYCDEFQLLASEMVASMLAELRRYGVALTLANQSLGQLAGDWFNPKNIIHSVLGNCGTFIVFRAGSEEAQRLGPMLNMEDHGELTRLGVGEMLVRRLADGLPLPAQRLTGLPPLSPPPAEAAPAAAKAVKRRRPKWAH